MIAAAASKRRPIGEAIGAFDTEGDLFPRQGQFVGVHPAEDESQAVGWPVREI
ncbi:MAG: hypothetical protein R2882_11970 [Gemmatimonadales bacterium]